MKKGPSAPVRRVLELDGPQMTLRARSRERTSRIKSRPARASVGDGLRRLFGVTVSLSASTSNTLASLVPCCIRASGRLPAAGVLRAQLGLPSPQIAAVPAAQEAQAGVVEGLSAHPGRELRGVPNVSSGTPRNENQKTMKAFAQDEANQPSRSAEQRRALPTEPTRGDERPEEHEGADQPEHARARRTPMRCSRRPRSCPGPARPAGCVEAGRAVRAPAAADPTDRSRPADRAGSAVAAPAGRCAGRSWALIAARPRPPPARPEARRGLRASRVAAPRRGTRCDRRTTVRTWGGIVPGADDKRTVSAR